MGPRGLSGFFQVVRNFIASSPVNLPLVALITSKIAAMPSQPPTAKKFGDRLSPYSRFHAAMKAWFCGRVAGGRVVRRADDAQGRVAHVGQLLVGGEIDGAETGLMPGLADAEIAHRLHDRGRLLAGDTKM